LVRGLVCFYYFTLSSGKITHFFVNRTYEFSYLNINECQKDHNERKSGVVEYKNRSFRRRFTFFMKNFQLNPKKRMWVMIYFVSLLAEN